MARGAHCYRVPMSVFLLFIMVTVSATTRKLSISMPNLFPPCPNRAAPTALPSPLPAGVAAALSTISALFNATLDPVSVPGGALSITFVRLGN